MDKNEKKCAEIRTTPCVLQVREALVREGENGGGPESRVIEGVAIVFNQKYEITDRWGDKHVECIAPEAVTNEWLGTQDVKMNLLHERSSTIARCNKGAGNLKMEVKADGVHFSFEAPKCDLGDRALELVRAGVYSGCSFEFWPKDYTLKESLHADGSVVTEVTYTAFESLEALTIAMDPAYQQTSVSTRELREKGSSLSAYRGKSCVNNRDVAAIEARSRQRRRAMWRNETENIL
jgi:HK97 family phage prohead protease